MKYEVVSLNTKKMLSGALKNAMKSKSLSKITVSELIEACGVNRKTFYYHFQDIYDLLKWTLEQEAIEVVKKFDLLVNLDDAISFVIDYVEDNRHILSCAYDSMGRDELRRFLLPPWPAARLGWPFSKSRRCFPEFRPCCREPPP